jgi:ATP phosphoribosyltransferase regulatory subunit
MRTQPPPRSPSSEPRSGEADGTSAEGGVVKRDGTSAEGGVVKRDGTFEHPLPAGMRDLLPEEAAARRALARKMVDRFALHGYGVVTLPVFEFAEVLERGLGNLDPADVLRFVEPESGEVAALRPDMTPQIARVIATRLRDRPAPYRLAYEGTVLRRRSGRARKHRQIPQVGVELAGVAGPEGDLELLALAADALRAIGLEQFTIDVGDAGVVRALLAPLSAERQGQLSEALARKDDAAIDDDTLRGLLTYCGGHDVLVEGVRRLKGTPAGAPAARLLALFDAAVSRGLGPHLVADLGEVRGFAYYTGTIFHAYAAGTGDAVVSGGRYDELLGRFGRDLPGAGFAVDLDRAAEALAGAGAVQPRAVRIVVVGPEESALASDLRVLGFPVVAIRERAAAVAWAAAWGFSHLVETSGDMQEWTDVQTGARIVPPLQERK